MKVLIYGMGRSGRAAARFARELDWDVQWMDQNPQPEDFEVISRLSLLEGSPSRHFDWVVAAPGVPIDHPDLQTLRRNQIPVIGELELGFMTRDVPIIGVTGTAGKGSTAHLIYQLLNASGVSASIGGNFDPPFLEVIDTASVAVVEISSFQLERIRNFRPHIGVLTNLGVDHLNRHGTVASYHAAKLNLFRNMTPNDTAVFPKSIGHRIRASKQRPFDDQPEALVDLDGKTIVAEWPDAHHPANLQAAVLATLTHLEHLGVDSELGKAISELKPLEGRFHRLGMIGGIQFIEDSIATRTLAVQSALERSKAPIVWILGGRDKGADLSPLMDIVRQKVAHIVGIGQDGAKLAREFGVPYSSVQPSGTGYDDMYLAAQIGLDCLGEEGTVLLAPLCESFDQFKNYKDRARAFGQAFLRLQREYP